MLQQQYYKKGQKKMIMWHLQKRRLRRFSADRIVNSLVFQINIKTNKLYDFFIITAQKRTLGDDARS